MAHVQTELARDRQRHLLAMATAQRDVQRALAHNRLTRRAKRAERLQRTHGDQAARLWAELDELESGS